MHRSIFFGALLLSVLTAAPSVSQTAARPKPAELPRVSFLWNDLQTPLSTEAFQEKMTLRDGLRLLSEELQRRRGRELPIGVNQQAFKDENPEAGDIHETEVQLKPHPRLRSVAQILRGLLGQVQTGNA